MGNNHINAIILQIYKYNGLKKLGESSSSIMLSSNTKISFELESVFIHLSAPFICNSDSYTNIL